MTFKEKLVKLRKLNKITQDEFACAVGVSRQAVYKWESGQSYPEVPKLIEMKHLFNISIDDLLDDNYEVVLPEKKKRRRRKPVAEEQIVQNAEVTEVVAEVATAATESAPVEPKEVPVAVAAPAPQAGATRVAPTAQRPAAPAPQAGAPRVAPTAQRPAAPAPQAGATRVAPTAQRPTAPAPQATPVNTAPVEPATKEANTTEEKKSLFGKFFGKK